jgi:fatty-acyl-CoA synthase
MRRLTHLRAIAIGGAAAPRSMIQGYAERHGVEILTSWGMTETAPMATISILPGDLAHLLSRRHLADDAARV